jgi:2,4-dienoyl-CoA reductase-like NADH-dependent reductase (Old Yellow Enzyme family)
VSDRVDAADRPVEPAAARFPRVKTLRDVDALRARLAELALDLPCDDDALSAADGSPLADPLPAGSVNRWVVQPMEGWDATTDGAPTDLVTRRWENFGRSGAGWVWGGEAVAVTGDGRANPRQLVIDEGTAPAIGALRAALVAAARPVLGTEPLVGLQLTHSGRWAHARPRTAFADAALDARAGIDDPGAVLSDDEVDGIVGAFGRAASLARDEGFAFVDVKHCHGYLLHEFLAARTRSGRWGGPSLADRTRLLDAVVQAVRTAAPDLPIGVRLSAFDLAPCGGFGVDDPAEPRALVRHLADLGVTMLNVTGGSPYYVPHVQRPAAFPPSDGYAPPEDPLCGVARLLHAARDAKAAAPGLTVVSSGWTYLQEYVPHVAQACVRDGWFDAVGLGRMMLSYPTFAADVLAGTAPDRERICRTFSDCTTAPRHGMVSGCYPLDPFYRDREERTELLRIKRSVRAERR